MRIKNIYYNATHIKNKKYLKYERSRSIIDQNKRRKNI